MAEVPTLWPAQAEAVEFALARPACMLDMGMGCGKTRVAIEVIRKRARRVLVVCPKAVIPVWPREISKYCGATAWMSLPRRDSWTVREYARRVDEMLRGPRNGYVQVVVVNYEAVWRRPLGDVLYQAAKDGLLDMVVLDESHRAKSAGSKVSKYLAMLGKAVPYRLCLSGTPMANSPLDVYGQYRFLDRSIFGTNHERFLQTYAVMGGPDRNFIVGFKNQQDLMARFRSIAYTCRIEDIADRAKLPAQLPDTTIPVNLPARDMRSLRDLNREFVAECGSGFITASNVLVKMLRMQQICAGFCEVESGPAGPSGVMDLNHAKGDALADLLQDVDGRAVVFGVFTHDMDEIRDASRRSGRASFELSGRANELEEWTGSDRGVLAVQIQAGAEGVDMTCASTAIYFSLPHSLALYEQSRARIHRPGQTRPTRFIHVVAEDTLDVSMLESLRSKRDVIDSIRSGSFDYGFMR